MENINLYKTISTFILLFIGAISYGQQTELRANAYSGLFFFRGNGATTTSTVYIGDVGGYYNPTSYGKKSGLSYAFELQTQRVTKQKLVFGLGLSYENLESKAIVDSFAGGSGKIAAAGTVMMVNNFVTINPYVGQRFTVKNVMMDAVIGLDLSFSTSVREEAKVTSPDQTYAVDKPNHPADLRPRIQLNTYYKNVGFLIGYSMGTANLYKYDNPNFNNKKAYANFIRLGVSYRLN